MVIIDVEATGLDHARCSLLSIGALYFEEPSNTFYQECRANENSLIVDQALEVNGFTRDQATDPNKQTQTELVRNFLEWLKPLKNKTFAGKNVHFDYYWIEREVMQNLPDFNVNPGLVELHTVHYLRLLDAGKEIPLKESGFSDLGFKKMLTFVGLPDVVITHNALEDVTLEAECMSRLLYGRSIIKKYSEFSIPHELVSLNGELNQP